MSKGELHQIEELPDLKVAWHESCKCLNEPLLEYVREVANHFLPDYEEADTGMIPVESSALPYSPTDMRRETYPLKKDTKEAKK